MSEGERPAPVLIGGSGSSGTTLLLALLAGHPELAVGPELAFFNKRVIYGDFERVRRELPGWLRSGVLTDGYFLQSTFLSGRAFHGIDDGVFMGWAAQAAGLEELVARLGRHVCRRQGARIFVEKTPTNAYTLAPFLERFPAGRVVHLVRDGRDVLCSLIARGFSPFEAASRWLYDTTAGLAGRGRPGYLELRYEDLVADPAASVRRVCEHVGVAFEPALLARADVPDVFREPLSSWRHAPTGPIAGDSVGRHARELGPLERTLFFRLRLTSHSARKLAVVPLAPAALLAAVGYAVPESPEPPLDRGAEREAAIDHQRHLAIDHQRRLDRLRAFGQPPEPPLLELAPGAAGPTRPSSVSGRRK